MKIPETPPPITIEDMRSMAPSVRARWHKIMQVISDTKGTVFIAGDDGRGGPQKR